MSDRQMAPVVEEIIRKGNRIRILVVGKTGVGKTSLIKKTFNVETLQSSHGRPGTSNIEEEITSKENDRFVIHDSEGYEPGDTSKLEQLQKFIKKRSGDVELSDKIHAIWLCIAIPHAGGRVLEKGTEILLETIPKDIAMVVVFTKYDKLVASKRIEIRKNDRNIDKETLLDSAQNKADEFFKVSCVELMERFMSSSGLPMRRFIKVSTEKGYTNTLSELVQTTEEQIELKQPSTGIQEPSEDEENRENVASLFGIAQMVDVEQKIELVIRLGKKKYWRGLASSTHFPGLGLQDCLNVLHCDIVEPWNIGDPEKFLLSKDFKSWITRLVEGLEKSQSLSVAGKHMSKSVGLAGSLAGVTGAAAGPAAPIVAPTVFVGVFLAHWVYETYKSTPDTVRCMMSYIVHLFHIMQVIFRRSLSGPGYTASKERIEDVCRKYQESALCKELSGQIDEFITNTKTLQYGNRDYVLEKLEALCRYYPHDLRRDGSST